MKNYLITLFILLFSFNLSGQNGISIPPSDGIRMKLFLNQDWDNDINGNTKIVFHVFLDESIIHYRFQRLALSEESFIRLQNFLDRYPYCEVDMNGAYYLNDDGEKTLRSFNIFFEYENLYFILEEVKDYLRTLN
jgi:hypothetical protein